MLAFPLLASLALAVAHGLIQRCYVCKSRGDLGDCKDPFSPNSSATGVQEVPCASGWCAKITEAGFETNDFDKPTERLCLQRPPKDEEERCAPTKADRRKVFMCFCHGDLCNAGPRRASPGALLLPLLLISRFFL